MKIETVSTKNKPGTAQVGFMSKAQKYSRNNNGKHLEKKCFVFQKIYLVKKVEYSQKTQKDTTWFIKRFFTNRKLQKFKGLPFDRIRKFSEKCHIVPKKTAKGDPLDSTILLEA